MIGDCRSAWKNPRILLTLMLIFLCGAVAGALTMRVGRHQAFGKPVAAKEQPSKEVALRTSLDKFKQELDLSSEQAEQMEIVLDDFLTYYQTLQAQMDDVRASGKERILRILRPEQKQRFEKMMSDLQSRQIQ